MSKIFKKEQDVFQSIFERNNFRRIVLLSPHPDDIAYSLGGSVYLIPPNCHSIIITVFNKSIYVSESSTNLNKQNITLLRKREELSYADRIGVQQFFLNFPDASILGYTAQSELQGNYKDKRFKYVCSKIDNLLCSISPDLIFCPIAIGKHIDHRIVFEAAYLSFLKNKWNMLYYEDLPYVYYADKVDLTTLTVDKLKTKTSTIFCDITEVIEKKRSNLFIYQSQVTPRDETAIINYAQRIHFERNCFAERLWYEGQF